MTPPVQASLDAARAALARNDLDEARRLLEAWLAPHPDDAEAALELGMLCYVAGDTERFAALHQAVAPQIQARPANRRLERLWQLSSRSFAAWSQAAALLGLSVLPLAGCDRPNVKPETVKVEAAEVVSLPADVAPSVPTTDPSVGADPSPLASTDAGGDADVSDTSDTTVATTDVSDAAETTVVVPVEVPKPDPVMAKYGAPPPRMKYGMRPPAKKYGAPRPDEFE